MTHDPTHGEPFDWQPDNDNTPGDTPLSPSTIFSVASPNAGKGELEQRAVRLVTTALEAHDAADVYLALKQIEHVVKTALDTAKRPAFDGFGRHLTGGTSGEYLGNKIAISYPVVTTYSPAVAALKAQHKLELEALQAKERAEGLTSEESGAGRITVTLKG
jgi:hypothetical protein